MLEVLQACGFFQALIPLVSSDFLSCRLLLLSSDASPLPLPSPTHTHTHTVHTWPTWIILRDADGLQFSNGAFSLRLTSLKRDLRVPKTGHFLSWLCESAHAVPSAWISLRMLRYSEMLPPLSVPGIMQEEGTARDQLLMSKHCPVPASYQNPVSCTSALTCELWLGLGSYLFLCLMFISVLLFHEGIKIKQSWKRNG